MKCCQRIDRQSGQGTVEAAVVIPVMFILMLLLLQPGIVLYDRVIMGSAAAEACRVLATSTDSQGSMNRSCEAFIRHRLSAIPQQDCFHVHNGVCSWSIEMSGDEGSLFVTTRIRNELRPLPLFDGAAKLLGMVNARGNLEIEESVTMQVQPTWVSGTQSGLAPASWIGSWCE